MAKVFFTLAIVALAAAGPFDIHVPDSPE
jgi:hypothetical protein